jgi:hypothetical protein
MLRPFTLSSTAATDNPSLLVLHEKGYKLRIRCYRKVDGTSYCLYFAMTDELRFTANSGAELLGLVALWEAYSKDWNKQYPDIMTENIEEDDDADTDGAVVFPGK